MADATQEEMKKEFAKQLREFADAVESGRRILQSIGCGIADSDDEFEMIIRWKITKGEAK